MKNCTQPSPMACQNFPVTSAGFYRQRAFNSESFAATRVDSLYQYLDLQEFFEQFSLRLKASHSVDGFDFNSVVGPYNYRSNPQVSYSGYYEVHAEVAHKNRKLGAISLFMRSQLSSHETTSVKLMLSRLGGPLNNALQYANACHSACHDSLTGLYNRAALNSLLFAEHSELLKTSRSSTNQLVLLVCDVDRFKSINDTCGHVTGDEVLRQFAGELRSIVGDDGVIFRYGGDEFVVALSNQSEVAAQKIAEKIRGHIEQFTFVIDSVPVYLTTTIGATRCQNESLERTFMRADSALMHGKNLGRNRVVWSRA